MDLRSYLKNTSKLSSKEQPSHSSCEEGNVPQAKRICSSSTGDAGPSKELEATSSDKRKYQKKVGEGIYLVGVDADSNGAFCKLCKKFGRPLERTGGVWMTRPFTNWKKEVEKMKAHAQTQVHSQAREDALAYQRSQVTGSVVQQLQNTADQDRIRNRLAIKSFIRCAHFLARQHIPHRITNFEKLIDLVVVQCDSQDLSNFLEKTGRNAVHTSHVAVVEFIEAIGTWVQEALLERLHKASFFSIMADECTDIATMEELSVFCRWEESGHSEEHFMEIVYLKQANAESIYSALVEFLKDKGLQVSNIVGMGFDGLAHFLERKPGVQARIKKVAPHALYVHCHCHLLQLACVQAANSTEGINHV